MVRVRKPYGLVKNFGDLIIVSEPNSKVPMGNFYNWKSFYSWVVARKLDFQGNILFKE